MLGIVTALFIPVFLWSTGLTSGTRSFWELSGMIATERIVLEEVNLRPAPSVASANCTIYVRNIGKTLITISDVFITDEFTGQTYAYGTSKFTTRDPVTNNPITSIMQGDLMKIYIPPGNLGFNPTTSRTYLIKVFTTRGVGDQYQVKA